MDCHDELRQQHEDDQRLAACADQLQRELTTWCPYETATGDARHPVLCEADGRYATRRHCDACKDRRNRRV
jgi:hypothetical protein